MISVKDADGVFYDAAKHFGVYCIHKLMEDQTKSAVIAYSYFQPNGGAELSASPKDRIYYVTKGSVTVSGKNGECHLLHSGDLVFIKAGQERAIAINDGKPAELLVILVNP